MESTLSSSSSSSSAAGSKKLSGFDRQLADAQKLAEEEEEELLKQREKMASQLMQNMQSVDGDNAGKGAVGNLVGLRSHVIGAAQEVGERSERALMKTRLVAMNPAK